jgi:polyhydroxybutyrate depolymerase
VAAIIASSLLAAPSLASTRGPLGQYGPGDHTVTMTVDGVVRSLLLHVPPNPAVNQRPLLLIYHGHGDTAQSTAAGTDFEAVSNSTGEVVAFLQGINKHWNDEAHGTSSTEPSDVAFTAAAITTLERVVAFDHKRIIAVGFSNGALMVEDLGCRLAGKLEMVVPIEGELAVTTSAHCAPARPLSVYEIHGTADTAIPYGGGQFGGSHGPVVLSAPKSAARWAQLDHCAKTPKSTYPSKSVKLTTYSRCRNRVAVTLRTIFGGVHEWGSGVGLIVYGALPPA